MKTKEISKSTLQRLPAYLNYLKTLSPRETPNISATALAAVLGLGEVQVRKDLASVSLSAGKPKTGYSVCSLIKEIEEYLGYNNIKDAVIIGAGKMGTALLNYSGFAQYGFNIVAAFDINVTEDGGEKGKKIFPLSKFGNLCKRLNIKIGIITAPASAAQEVCDLMVANNILAVWNFAPIHLNVPEHILLHNENMAVSLAILSKHLKENLKKSKKHL
ncbi:DNA-binding protein [Elusimicrobium minutum Pei191]|uniref:Redox-sensing transcriptional repressor Rex n=1 Tax=Elusimicrobium minutum (strain Pei191) TaxID=445932 RepID=B2KCR5_ELUMP|nr:redox-sensing transcriptional repressor Rex [Elusimicrobium minutum]ACC98311.1 DNA-binding protein [Elusimicrobium minutum Pei191]